MWLACTFCVMCIPHPVQQYQQLVIYNNKYTYMYFINIDFLAKKYKKLNFSQYTLNHISLTINKTILQILLSSHRTKVDTHFLTATEHTYGWIETTSWDVDMLLPNNLTISCEKYLKNNIMYVVLRN